MMRKRLLLLPDMYRRIEYLESTGTQYIDSQIECTGDLSVEFKFSVPTLVNLALCGGINTSNNPIYFRHHCSANQNAMYWIQNNSGSASVTLQQYVSVNTDYSVTIDATNGIATVNGINYSFTALPGTLTTGKGYGIFARIADTGAMQFRPARIYYFKFSKNGTPLGNFIPCIRTTDNKPGMYDTLTKTFFINEGTGEFVTP